MTSEAIRTVCCECGAVIQEGAKARAAQPWRVPRVRPGGAAAVGAAMSRDPRRQPKRARVLNGAKDAWWYEEPEGITVCTEAVGGVWTVRLPWGVVLRAAQRSSGREVVVKPKTRRTR